MKTQTSLLFVLVSLVGCSFHARGPEQYREAVRAILDSKRPDVEACYKRVYEADPVAQGRVVAKFQLEAKSGKLVKPQIVSEGTTASEGLKQCVLSSLEGITLAPPDQRTGDATFTWEFAR
jgi:hypothetical protein